MRAVGAEDALAAINWGAPKVTGLSTEEMAKRVDAGLRRLDCTIHRVEGQLKEEGLAGVPFESTLAESVFCGNVLLTVGGSTPYNALYGRVPHVLPSIDQITTPEEGSRPGQTTLAHTHTHTD